MSLNPEKKEPITYPHIDVAILVYKQNINALCEIFMRKDKELLLDDSSIVKRNSNWKLYSDAIVNDGKVLRILREARLKETEIQDATLALKYLVARQDRGEVEKFADSVVVSSSDKK